MGFWSVIFHSLENLILLVTIILQFWVLGGTWYLYGALLIDSMWSREDFNKDDGPSHLEASCTSENDGQVER